VSWQTFAYTFHGTHGVSTIGKLLSLNSIYNPYIKTLSYITGICPPPDMDPRTLTIFDTRWDRWIVQTLLMNRKYGYDSEESECICSKCYDQSINWMESTQDITGTLLRRWWRWDGDTFNGVDKFCNTKVHVWSKTPDSKRTHVGTNYILENKEDVVKPIPRKPI